MAVNSTIFFNQLKSAFVPLLKRVIALIPTKASDLTNDEGFIAMPDVTQATKVDTPPLQSLNLNTEPTFLVSEESSASGGAVAVGVEHPNAGNTSYALKRYSLSVLQTLVSGGTNLTELTDVYDVYSDTDWIPLVRYDDGNDTTEAYKVNLQILMDAIYNDIYDDIYPFFDVYGDLSLQTMQVTNLSETFEDAMAAVGSGKTVKLHLSYTSYVLPGGITETAIADAGVISDNYFNFAPLIVANLGTGITPYLFRVFWDDSGMTLTPFALSVQS